MKVVAKKAQLALDDDPRPRDRATWQRLRILIEDEACHRDWGCALYRLHRTGRIDNDAREAGDRYASLIRDYRKLWHDPIGFSIDTPGQARDYDTRCEATRPVEMALGWATAEMQRDDSSEFEVRRAKKIGRNYREARGVAGRINNALEDLLIDEIWPAGEREKKEISNALIRLSHFFSTGTKREPRK